MTYYIQKALKQEKTNKQTKNHDRIIISTKVARYTIHKNLLFLDTSELQ